MKPKTKIGEAQVQQTFVEYLKYKICEKFGPNYPYNYGAFNGGQDKKYADYFAGVNAKNILIEFKEFKSEISTESRKPLRKKLCNTISDLNFSSSINSHFIAWRLDNSIEQKIKLKIDTYLPTVCPFFVKHFLGNNERWISEFINDFLNMETGISNEDFELYINELSNVAGDDGDSSFYGIHLTFDHEHGLDFKIFSTIAELIEFSNNLNLSKSPSPKNEKPSPEDDEPSPYRGGPSI